MKEEKSEETTVSLSWDDSFEVLRDYNNNANDEIKLECNEESFKDFFPDDILEFCPSPLALKTEDDDDDIISVNNFNSLIDLTLEGGDLFKESGDFFIKNEEFAQFKHDEEVKEVQERTKKVMAMFDKTKDVTVDIKRLPPECDSNLCKKINNKIKEIERKKAVVNNDNSQEDEEEQTKIESSILRQVKQKNKKYKALLDSNYFYMDIFVPNECPFPHCEKFFRRASQMNNVYLHHLFINHKIIINPENIVKM